MQELNIIKFIKDNFGNKNFAKIFVSSLLAIILIFIILFSIVWYLRVNIFGYFAREYLQEMENINNVEGVEMDTLRTSENKNIISPERYVIDAVKKANPAVVSIIISKEVPKYKLENNQSSPFGDLFPGFNFNFPQYRQDGTEKKEIGGGSGFLVSKDGLIVTNKHVVNQEDVEYVVFTNDEKRYEAKIVARDPILDIALLQIEGKDFSYLSLGDSEHLEVGQSVIAIGNALAEYRNTVSVGVVSGLARSVVAGDSSGNSELLDHVIQTDAAINPGNSGGPLLDLSGRVIGVNVAIVQGSQNIGFALPINSVKSAIDSVQKTGKIIRPYLGIRYVVVNEEMKEKNNLAVDYGVLVKAGASVSELAVIPGSPADKAGIVENDIILEIDGVKLNDKNSLASIIRGKNVGQIITLKILHRGEEKNVSVTLEVAKDD